MKKMNWGIVGTGLIAHEMGAALQKVNGEVYAVFARKAEKAEQFAEEFGVQKIYTDLTEMMADPDLDVVYIATPHSTHYEIMLQAVRAGKHVLCEKAITVNSRQLEECVAEAEKAGVTISDAMTIFHMPLYRRLREIIDSGKLGKLKLVQVNFGSCREYDTSSRFFAKEMAGGGLLDIGVYATSFARFFLSSNPNVILTTANYFENGVDETSGILMKNPDGEMVVMALTMCAKQPKRGVVAFEKGYIEVTNYPRAQKATITYTCDGHQEEVEAGSTADALCYEVQDMERYIREKSGQDNLRMVRDVMEILSAVKNQWGLVYPFE